MSRQQRWLPPLGRRAFLAKCGAGVLGASAAGLFWLWRRNPTYGPPPTSETHRRNALLALPPDSERKIDIFMEKGRDLGDLNRIDYQPGMVIAFEMGARFTGTPDRDNSFPWISAAGDPGNPVLFTVYGDRDKPWPFFTDSPNSFGFRGCSDIVVEFLEGGFTSGTLWRLDRCGDVTLRYMTGHDSGKVKGLGPGAGNRGNAFAVSDSEPGAIITLSHLEAWNMAEDLLHDLRGNERATIVADDIYGHDNREDTIDLKSVGSFTGRNVWGLNCDSKGMVVHGTAGKIMLDGFNFSGQLLHSGVYMDGRDGFRADEWVFLNGIANNNGRDGFTFKRMAGRIFLRNVDMVGNDDRKLRKGVGTDELYCVRGDSEGRLVDETSGEPRTRPPA